MCLFIADFNGIENIATFFNVNSSFSCMDVNVLSTRFHSLIVNHDLIFTCRSEHPVLLNCLNYVGCLSVPIE